MGFLEKGEISVKNFDTDLTLRINNVCERKSKGGHRVSISDFTRVALRDKLERDEEELGMGPNYEPPKNPPRTY